MSLDRIKLYAIVAAVAASLTGEVTAQTPSGSPGMASPTPAGTALTPGPAQQPASPARARNDSMLSPASPTTQTPSSRALGNNAAATSNNPATGNANSTTGAVTGAGAAITGGLPGMSGVTPNRAELPSSAFTKLNGASRGYVTLEDVRQLDGFESAFRQADLNGDGRLNASEFNSAWGAYTGNTR